MNGIARFRDIGLTRSRVTLKSDLATDINTRLAASADQMERELLAIAEEDGATIPDNPGSLSRLAEQHVSEHDGYLMYAMLNVAGAHPGPARAFLFYGNLETGFSDYDFKRMFDRRAYWTAVAIWLYLDLCDLAAPVLGWPDWEATAAATREDLQPLADEAVKRYEEPLHRALSRIPNRADAAD